MSSTLSITEGINKVPVETVLQVAKYLSQKDRANLARTCRGFSTFLCTFMLEQDAAEDHYALLWACTKNNVHVLNRVLSHSQLLVNYVFQKQHSIKIDGLKHTCKTPLSPITAAIRLRSFDVLEVLLRRGADVNTPDPSPIERYSRRWYPVNWAVHYLQEEADLDKCLGLLKTHGANMNLSPLYNELDPSPNGNGRLFSIPYGDLMSLHSQLHFGPPQTSLDQLVDFQTFKDCFEKLLKVRLRKVKVLLKHGTNPNATESFTHHRPICQIVTHLTEYDPDPFFLRVREPVVSNQRESLYAEIIIPYAIRFIRALIKSGANPNLICIPWRRAPLHTICRHSQRYEKVINLLLEVGANINAEDNRGRTPLHIMAKCPPADSSIIDDFITKVLVSGGNINHQDRDGRTALHTICAEYNGSRAILHDTVELLVSRGANAALVDSHLCTALDLLNGRRFGVLRETYDFLAECEGRAQTPTENDEEDEHNATGSTGAVDHSVDW